MKAHIVNKIIRYKILYINNNIIQITYLHEVFALYVGRCPVAGALHQHKPGLKWGPPTILHGGGIPAKLALAAVFVQLLFSFYPVVKAKTSCRLPETKVNFKPTILFHQYSIKPQ